MPAVRRALATELRRLREHASLSGDVVAERLGWSASKVSRIETHRTGIKRRDLDRLLDLYGADEATRHQLEALADEQDARGWWTPLATTFPAAYVTYIGLEDSAATLQSWSPELIHGLLQTEDYARATMQSAFGSPPRVPPAKSSAGSKHGSGARGCCGGEMPGSTCSFWMRPRCGTGWGRRRPCMPS